MSKITISLIGCGNIISSHLEAMNLYPEIELIGVCDHSRERLHQIAAELGCRSFGDYRDLLKESPGVVVISLPHHLHCPVAVDALAAGCHVMVEKPMAISVDECRRMLKAAHELGKHLIVTEIGSFEPGAVLTGSKFRAGKLGRFFTGGIFKERYYFHEGRPAWFLDPALSGGGMFLNVGMHRLAVVRACLPGLIPISVSASVCHLPEYRVEACASVMVRYKQGGSMLYEEVGYYPRPDWLNTGTHFIFEEGIVAWDDQIWRIMTKGGREIEEPLSVGKSLYAPIYSNMLCAMRGEDYGPKAWEYAVDIAIAQAAYSSAREGREIDLTQKEWAMIES